MKVKLSILALCGLFAFTSCDDDDNNYLPDQTVTKAFDEKYPGVGKVEWETKSGYEVADFHLSGNKAEAWFDNKGNWVMTKTEINFGLLPEPVRLSLNGGEYKNWKPTDFDKLERSNAATVYVIEVEQGEQEVDLYYTEDGVLLKAVPDDDNDNNFQPVVTRKQSAMPSTRCIRVPLCWNSIKKKMVLKWISSIIISTRMFISTLKTNGFLQNGTLQKIRFRQSS